MIDRADRRPNGQAIRWSAMERARLSRLTPAQVAMARVWWWQHAPARWRRLLEAAEEVRDAPR